MCFLKGFLRDGYIDREEEEEEEEEDVRDKEKEIIKRYRGSEIEGNKKLTGV